MRFNYRLPHHFFKTSSLDHHKPTDLFQSAR
jgi:hypothetical protein